MIGVGVCLGTLLSPFRAVAGSALLGEFREPSLGCSESGPGLVSS